MTNGEFYKEKIWEIACKGQTVAKKNGELIGCNEIKKCFQCDFYGDTIYDCTRNFELWVNSEYVSELPYEIPKDTIIDTPVIVWDYDGLEFPNHFAGFKIVGEKVKYLTFDGGTSWTSNCFNAWKHCRLATDEEIAKEIKVAKETARKY